MEPEMKFVDLCRTLDKISSAEKDKKVKILLRLLDYCKQQKSNATGKSKSSLFYQVVRLLLPKLDFERGPYGVKEHNLGKMYCRILCLSKDSADHNKIMNFRAPKAGNTAGDFAEVAYWVLKSRCRDGGVLTVDQVNSHLDNIAKFHAENEPRSVDDELTAMVVNMSAEEQKWLIRILLKDLRVGFGQSFLLNALHPDANDLYDTCNNLRKVCDTLHDRSKRLHEIEVSIFEPCKPMLSAKCDVLTVGTVLRKAPYYFLERKHDGERFQLHMENDSYRYYSRKGHEYTDNFGGTSNSGVLTPQLSKQLCSDVTSLILDGEMMGWNKKWKCFVTKGENLDVKHLREGDKYRPCFCVFDILLLNGEILTNKPLKERLEILQQVFTPFEGVFMETRREEVTNSSEVVRALNYAIDNQEEGLILKDPNSVYKPASTKGGWYKIKPEFTDQLSDDLDLLIMGGYYGDGRRRGNVSHFLLGVAVPPRTHGTDPTEFHSVCRVGSGYSKEELSELSEKLLPFWNNVRHGHLIPGLKWAKERPDVWIRPCHSHILQVKASEIQVSDQYETGCTLRFPRVVTVRYDKEWSKCLTLTELNSIRSTNKGKLATKHINEDDVGLTSPRKRFRGKAALCVGQEFRPAVTAGVALTGTRLYGKEIVVINGNDIISKEQLEKRIVSEGGIVAQNRGSDTFCVVVGKQNAKCKFVSAFGGVDVVSVDWLLRLLDGNDNQWTPHDLFSMSAKTEEEMAIKYDPYFDGYQKHTNVENLKLSLLKVSEKEAFVNLLPSEMADLDEELFYGPNEFAIFRCCVAYFVKPSVEVIARESNMLCVMFRFHGGHVSNILSSDITHVIMHRKDLDGHCNIIEENHSRQKKFHVVSLLWILNCCRAQRRLEERNYSHFLCC